MPSMVQEKKSSRLDLRMTEDQRNQIDMAARINGMSVSQWSLNQLMESARRDIFEQGLVRLSADAFDRFAALLDAEPDPMFEVFRGEQTRWEQ